MKKKVNQRKEITGTGKDLEVNDLVEESSLDDIVSEAVIEDKSKVVKLAGPIYVSNTVPGNIGRELRQDGKYLCDQCDATFTAQGNLVKQTIQT